MIFLVMMQNLKKNNKVTEFIQKRSKMVRNDGRNRL